MEVTSYFTDTFSSAYNPTKNRTFLIPSWRSQSFIFFFPFFLYLSENCLHLVAVAFLYLPWTRRAAVVFAVIYGRAADACDKK